MLLKKELIQEKRQKSIRNDFDVFDNEHHAIMISPTKESWLIENQDAIAAYNQHIADSGVFSDGLRCF